VAAGSAVAGGTIGAITQLSASAAAAVLKGYFITTTSYLFQLDWNEEIMNDFYDKYWDAVSIEATWKGIGRREGEKDGLEKGLRQGLQQGREEGREDEKRQLALNMLAKGFAPNLVAEITGMTEAEILTLGTH
jgi:hypothetical protein